MPGKREEYASWAEYFMGIASLSTTRSKDPSTQVGACIANEENKILSVGYNGLTQGMDDDAFYWNSEGEITGDKTRIKDPYVIHAERNAIYNYRGSLSDFKGSTMYVTFFPCYECAKSIAQVGIKRVVYRRMYSKSESNHIAKEILEAAGIELVAFSKDAEIVTKQEYQQETEDILKMVKKYGHPSQESTK